MKRLILGAVLALTSCPSWGTAWTILEVQNEMCVPAATFAQENGIASFASPYAVREYMRAHVHAYSGTSVWNTPNGLGRMVEIKAGSRAVYYFSSMAFCQKALRISQKNGTLPNLSELK